MPYFRRFTVVSGNAVAVDPGWVPIGVVVVKDEAYVVCQADAVEDGVPKPPETPRAPQGTEVPQVTEIAEAEAVQPEIPEDLR